MRMLLPKQSAQSKISAYVRYLAKYNMLGPKVNFISFSVLRMDIGSVMTDKRYKFVMCSRLAH